MLIRTPVQPYNQDTVLRSERRARMSADRRQIIDQPRDDKVTKTRGRSKQQTESDNDDSDLPRAHIVVSDSEQVSENSARPKHDSMPVSSTSNHNFQPPHPSSASASPSIASQRASSALGAGSTPSSRSFSSRHHHVGVPTDVLSTMRQTSPPPPLDASTIPTSSSSSSSSIPVNHNMSSYIQHRNIHEQMHAIQASSHPSTARSTGVITPVTAARAAYGDNTVETLLSEPIKVLNEMDAFRQSKHQQDKEAEYLQAQLIEQKRRLALERLQKSELKKMTEKLRQVHSEELHEANLLTACEKALLESATKKLAQQEERNRRLEEELERMRAIMSNKDTMERLMQLSNKTLIKTAAGGNRRERANLPPHTYAPSDPPSDSPLIMSIPPMGPLDSPTPPTSSTTNTIRTSATSNVNPSTSRSLKSERSSLHASHSSVNADRILIPSSSTLTHPSTKPEFSSHGSTSTSTVKSEKKPSKQEEYDEDEEYDEEDEEKYDTDTDHKHIEQSMSDMPSDASESSDNDSENDDEDDIRRRDKKPDKKIKEKEPEDASPLDSYNLFLTERQALSDFNEFVKSKGRKHASVYAKRYSLLNHRERELEWYRTLVYTHANKQLFGAMVHDWFERVMHSHGSPISAKAKRPFKLKITVPPFYVEPSDGITYPETQPLPEDSDTLYELPYALRMRPQAHEQIAVRSTETLERMIEAYAYQRELKTKSKTKTKADTKKPVDPSDDDESDEETKGRQCARKRPQCKNMVYGRIERKLCQACTDYMEELKKAALDEYCPTLERVPTSTASVTPTPSSTAINKEPKSEISVDQYHEKDKEVVLLTHYERSKAIIDKERVMKEKGLTVGDATLDKLEEEQELVGDALTFVFTSAERANNRRVRLTEVMTSFRDVQVAR